MRPAAVFFGILDSFSKTDKARELYRLLLFNGFSACTVNLHKNVDINWNEIYNVYNSLISVLGGFVVKKTAAVLLVLILLLGVFSICAASAGVLGVVNEPVIVDTLYPTDDVVIADIVLSDGLYGVDSTGTADSTESIQNAIDDCAAAGGGTVFLPAGRYRVTGPVYIRPFVTLRGDWQDPDAGSDYGTVIIADVPSSELNQPALFTVGGSAGAVGLTVFYPRQDINDLKPYPYTFYVTGQGDSYMLQSIMNCTLINSYKGIGACVDENNAHEMITLENIKGTVLNTGMALFNQADVGTAKNITFSNHYWASAGELYNAPSLEDIDSYTRQNGTGLLLGDLEWMQFANINVSDYKFGIRFEKGKRASFAGAFYYLYISDCVYGIDITKNSLDERWGMVIAKAEIEGSEYAIRNQTQGAVKMTEVSLVGNTSGSHLYKSAAVMDEFSLDYSVSEPKPEPILYVFDGDKTGHTDISAALQSLLDTAGLTGGVVYVPAGCYRLDAPVSVPAGVELRGSSGVPTRDQVGNSKGTLFLSYYGYDIADSKAVPALITLSGEGAGINGVRIVFALNNPAISGDAGIVRKTSYAVRGAARAVYAKNICVITSSGAILMENSNDFFIKKAVGLSFDNFINVTNSNGGHIEGCLQNANSLSRNGFASMGIDALNGWITEDKLFTHVFNPITRQRNVTLQFENAGNLTVLNAFAYGTKTFVNMNDSENVLLVNIGADNIGDNAPMLRSQGGSMTAVNILRYNGYSYENDGTHLQLYNRISINEKLSEWNFGEDFTPNTSFWGRIMEFFRNLFEKIQEFFSRIFG